MFIDAVPTGAYLRTMHSEIGLEWDETKRQATLDARGVDFADATELDWDAALTAADGRHSEARFVTIGPIRGRLHVMAWCWRGTKMRVISLRKANEREVRRYEQAID